MEITGSPAPINLYISTSIGIEDITKEEIKEVLKDREIKVNPFEFRGKIFVRDVNLKEIPHIFFKLRTTERIGILTGVFECDLNKLKNYVFSLNIKDFYKKNLSIAVRCKKRNNKIKLSKQEISAEIGKWLIRRIRDEFDFTPSVNLEEPDFILRCDISERYITFWLDLTGNSAMHIRKYRVFEHPAPIKGNIAFALIKKMGIKENKIFVDPMTGGGTIPIECAMWAKNISPYHLRNDFLIFKLKPFEDLKKEDFMKTGEREKNLKIFGSDINLEFLKGAKENAKRAGVEDYVKFINLDAKDLSKAFKKIDYIAFNPPYGLRMRIGEEEKGIMKKFFEEAEKVLSDKGKIGIITARMDLVRKHRRDFRIIWRRKIFHGGVRIFGFILRK